MKGQGNWFKRHPKITVIIIGWIVLMFLALLMVGNDVSKDSQNTNSGQPLTIKQQMDEDIREILGTSNRNVEKIKEIIITEGENGYFIGIRYNADDNLNSKMIKGYIINEDIKVLKTLYTKYENISGVGIIAYFPLTDAYGNNEDEAVINLRIDRATADKINWDGLLPENIPTIADKYYIHPALTQ
ncbi:MAG: hypothetical protein AABX03_02180 [Nanoarchaeota archaeon]